MDNFNIIGITVETLNQNGQSLNDLEKLWGQFWDDDIKNQIPNRLSDDIYAVYTDYENGDKEKYRVILGFIVKTLNKIPKGFIGRKITVGNHKKYLSKGKMPEAIILTWAEISQDKELNRAFHADVTVHGKKSFDGDEAEVETFISI